MTPHFKTTSNKLKVSSSRGLKEPVRFTAAQVPFLKRSSCLTRAGTATTVYYLRSRAWQSSVLKPRSADRRFRLNRSIFDCHYLRVYVRAAFFNRGVGRIATTRQWKTNKWRILTLIIDAVPVTDIAPSLLSYITVVGPHTTHPRSPRNVWRSHWRDYFNADVMFPNGAFTAASRPASVNSTSPSVKFT